MTGTGPTTAVEVPDYVSRAVLPAMGIGGRPFTVSAPEPGGTRSSLHLIHAEGMPPLLMRVFDHRGQAARNVAALRHLDGLSLPAPRLVFYDLWPTHITVETWIEGTRHAAIADQALASSAALRVAGLLARYHAVTRPLWGRPGATLRGRVVPFVTMTLVIARRMIKHLGACGWLSGSETGSAIERFGCWRETIGALSAFNLVHNDANRHNFVVGPSGEVTPVDLHRLAYEPFVEELVNALYHFCRKDPDLGARFIESYFAVAGEASRALFERTCGFFEPLNHLKKMHRRSLTRVPSDDAKMLQWREALLSIEAPG